MVQTRVRVRRDSAIKRAVEMPPRLKREGWYVPAGEENAPFWSASNLRELNRAIEGIEAGHVVVKTLEELDAMASS